RGRVAEVEQLDLIGPAVQVLVVDRTRFAGVLGELRVVEPLETALEVVAARRRRQEVGDRREQLRLVALDDERTIRARGGEGRAGLHAGGVVDPRWIGVV